MNTKSEHEYEDIEQLLRKLAPSDADLRIEETLFRAGWEAGRQSVARSASKRSDWLKYVAGSAVGMAASLLVMFLIQSSEISDHWGTLANSRESRTESQHSASSDSSSSVIADDTRARSGIEDAVDAHGHAAFTESEQSRIAAQFPHGDRSNEPGSVDWDQWFTWSGFQSPVMLESKQGMGHAEQAQRTEARQRSSQAQGSPQHPSVFVLLRKQFGMAMEEDFAQPLSKRTSSSQERSPLQLRRGDLFLDSPNAAIWQELGLL